MMALDNSLSWPETGTRRNDDATQMGVGNGPGHRCLRVPEHEAGQLSLLDYYLHHETPGCPWG